MWHDEKVEWLRKKFFSLESLPPRSEAEKDFLSVSDAAGQPEFGR